MKSQIQLAQRKAWLNDLKEKLRYVRNCKQNSLSLSYQFNLFVRMFLEIKY